MRFSLKKTLSLLHFHRRTKSESSMMIPKMPQLVEPMLFQSKSLPIIERLSQGVEATDSTISIERATTAFHSAHSHSSKAGSLNPDLSDAGTAQEYLIQLETDKKELSDQISALLVVASIHKQNCVQLQEDILYEKGVSTPQRKVEGGQDDDQANRVAQLERFVSAMIDLGLHIPVLDKAYKAVLDGEMADDALVDAIKDAAARPGTAWARILPAVVGPRAPENYVSAINLTLKCRRELKHTKKVLNFWKKKAMSYPTNHSLVTPSASALSDVVEEFGPERRNAMRNLLRRRGRLDSRIPLRTLRTIARTSTDTLSSLSVDESIDDRASDITERPKETPEESTIPVSCSDPIDTGVHPALAELPPLASQVFREELLASHSTKTFKLGRSIISNMGLNRLGHRQETSSSTISSVSSANISEKRHGVVLAHSSESILALSEWKLPEGELISLSSTVNLEYAQDTPFFTRQTSVNLISANANPGVRPGGKRRSVEESIASLTRICAAFGDDDSDSSPSASESSEGEVHWRSFEFGPHTVTTVSHDPGPLHSEHAHEIHPSQSPEHQPSSPKEPARDSPNRSMLPVFKGLGRLSISISPTKKKVGRPTLPIDRPTASSASRTIGTPDGKAAAASNLKRARQKGAVQPRSASLLPSSSVPQRAVPRVASLTAPNRAPNHRIVTSGKKAVRSISRILS